MKLSQQLLLLSIALCILTGCDDRLDVDPPQNLDGNVVFQVERDVNSVLIGTYAEAGKDESYGGQLQLLADLLGSNGFVSWFGTFFEPSEVFNKAILVDNGFIELLWTNHYATINQANLVLDNLDVVESDEVERDRIEGEARFLRALCYFDLVRHFASGSIGVPLRTTGITDYDVDLSIGRAATDEVYELVISDLSTAIALLPPTNTFFADRYSAQGLLARVQLQRGDFANARDAANDVIQNSDHMLAGTFADAFNRDSDGIEDVFAFQVTSQDGQNDLITHYASEANGGRGGDIAIADAYIEIFDSNDVRGTFFYVGDFGDRLTGKYTNQFGNIPLIRLAEMYLIRAEGNLNEETTVGASPLEDLNTIRNRSGADELDDTVEIDTDLILNERFRELAFEGFFVHDLRRLGRTVDDFDSNAAELVYPIPQAETDTNPVIEQNPGY